MSLAAGSGRLRRRISFLLLLSRPLAPSLPALDESVLSRGWFRDLHLTATVRGRISATSQERVRNVHEVAVPAGSFMLISAEDRMAPNRPTKVLLADDHTRFREGLAGLLASYGGLEVVAGVPNDSRVPGLVRELAPDVVIMRVRGETAVEAKVPVEPALGAFLQLEGKLVEHGSPGDKLLAFFDAYRDSVVSGGLRGCAFVNCAAEFPDRGHPARAVVREHKAAMRRRLADLASEAGAEEPEARAEGLFVLLEGACVPAAMEGDEGVVDRVRGLAGDLVAAAVARPGSSRG